MDGSDPRSTDETGAIDHRLDPRIRLVLTLDPRSMLLIRRTSILLGPPFIPVGRRSEAARRDRLDAGVLPGLVQTGPRRQFSCLRAARPACPFAPPVTAVYTPIHRIRLLARHGARAIAASIALAALSACGGGGGGGIVQPHVLTVNVTSTKLERGYTVAVAVSDGGTAVPDGSYTLSFDPADGGVTLGGGQVRLAKSGTVKIIASANGAQGSAQLTVAAPPIVVFDRSTAGNRDIWRVDLDGQNLVQLTNDPGEDQDPAVAQGRVVWISYRAGNAELYSAPLAGGTNTRVTTTSANESTPSISPDGTKLAFAQDVGGVTKVFTSAGDGTGPARATPNDFGYSGVIETAPAWTTGNRLAFVATANGSADIFSSVPPVMPTLLAGGNTAEVEPAWNTDGSKLAFVSNRTGSTEIFLLTVSTGTVTQLTAGAGTKSQPAWTPDGRVVYTETLSGSRLRWVDPAQPGTITTIDTGTGTVGHPAIAPAP